MKLSVIAVGRLKSGPEKALADNYRERVEVVGRKAGLTRLTVTEFGESQLATPAARMADEARLVGEAIPPKAFVVALDERGRNLTSEAFATRLKQEIDGGADVAFVIGGPDGHGEAVRTRANLLLAFGAMTWPHRLVRVMLFEQIYRAVTIMVNHPYHRP